jgi:hypothetical protein
MRYLTLTVALLAAGCCTTEPRVPVYVETTLARLEIPERPTRAVRLSSGMTDSTWYVLSDDHITQPPSIERSYATRQDPEPQSTCDDDWEPTELIGRIDVCLAKRVAFGYSRRSDGMPMGHMVLYLAGREREHAKAGHGSLAVSVAYGRQERSMAGTNYRTNLERRQTDVSLIFGYRMAKWALFYGGPYHLRSDFDLQHTRPDTPRQDSSGLIAATGGHLGLGLFAGRHSNWLVEYSRARVDSGVDGEILGNWSFKYQLEFWGAPAKLRRHPPVKAGEAAPGIPATASR